MSEWSVHVEVRGSEPLGADVADSIDVLVDELVAHGAAVSGGPGSSTYGAQLTVEAPTPGAAVTLGIEYFRKAAAVAGLPEWPVVDAQATDVDELDRQLAVPNFPELVGTREIADILEVSRQRAHQIAQRDDFPSPIAELATGPVWTRPSLNHFLALWPRTGGRPPKGRVVAPKPYEVGDVIDTVDGLRRVVDCRLLDNPSGNDTGWVIDTEPVD